MKLTNKFGLPKAIVRAVTFYPHEKRGDISVTQLVGPPRIHQLRIRHPDEITEDVSDRLWALLGSTVHYFLHAARVDDALQEETMVWLVGDVKLFGTPDYFEDERISDWKITSVWAILDGVKPEWEAQLNLYKGLYRHYGFDVSDLEICALLRDWSKGRARQGGDYPPVAFRRLPVTLWSKERLLHYAEKRAGLHQRCFVLPDSLLPLCTSEERWERPTKWAVRKLGNKRATKLCDTEKEADQFIDGLLAKARTAKVSYLVEQRPGECVRCEGYCNVSHLCDWWKKRNQEAE